MVWIFALVPVVILLFSRNARPAIFGIMVVLGLFLVILGNPAYLMLDLIFFGIVLVVILFSRWDKTRPQLTPEQQKEQERQRQEAERIRQEKASALADIRGKAFNLGLLTVPIAIVMEGMAFPTDNVSAGIVVALLTGVLAYQMRVFNLVGKHPLLDQNRDIDGSWMVYSIITLALSLSFVYISRSPSTSPHIRHSPAEAPTPTLNSNSEMTVTPETPTPSTRPASKKYTTRPNADLRHCLKLGSDAEIARCAERP